MKYICQEAKGCKIKECSRRKPHAWRPLCSALAMYCRYPTAPAEARVLPSPPAGCSLPDFGKADDRPPAWEAQTLMRGESAEAIEGVRNELKKAILHTANVVAGPRCKQVRK